MDILDTIKKGKKRGGESVNTCRSCRFAVRDETTNEVGWCGIMCSNPESEYYKSLLNTSKDGNKLDKVTWGGCPKHEKYT